MLPLPPESAHTGRAGRSLYDRYAQHLAANLTGGSAALLRGQSELLARLAVVERTIGRRGE